MFGKNNTTSVGRKPELLFRSKTGLKENLGDSNYFENKQEVFREPGVEIKPL